MIDTATFSAQQHSALGPHLLTTVPLLLTQAETCAKSTADFLHRCHASVQELCTKLKMPEVPPPIALRVGMRPNVEPRVR